MDLLSQQTETKTSKFKKIVLICLVIAIITLVVSILAMMKLKEKENAELKIHIDQNALQITETTLIDDNSTRYISLNQIARFIGYDFRRGGYLEQQLSENKCYLESNNQIIGFEADSNIVYKTTLESEKDYQYFQIKNNVLKAENGEFYRALEDLNVACNVIYKFLEEKNLITINTLEYASKYYGEELEKKGLLMVNDDFESKKILSYGNIITKINSNIETEKKVGLMDINYNILIGNRYNSMSFDEYTKKLIVSNSDNKYGVIDMDGRVSIELNYEDIQIINYNPLLYKVKQNKYYGIINKNGIRIGNIEYNDIGIINRSDKKKILIIKDIKDGIDGIVVNKNKKYGIMDLNSGKEIIECELDNISYEKEDGKIVYYIEIGETRTTLDRYIDYKETIVVNLSN